jgi:hypothetical protein
MEGMRRLHVAFVVSVGSAALAACNALSGASDLEVGVGEAGVDASGAPADASADVGADSTVDTGPPLPSLCSGITLYLPFDGTLVAKTGQAPEMPVPDAGFIGGKFGSAVDLRTAIAIFYANGGAYSIETGTLAMWFRPTWTPPCTGTGRALFKPKLDQDGAVPSAGPQLVCASAFGFYVAQADGGTPGASFPNAAPSSWVQNGWNHVVGTWDRAAGSIALVVNGVDATTSADTWTPGESTANHIRLGSDGNPAGSAFDEVVLWNRALTAAELLALEAVSQPIGDLCRL